MNIFEMREESTRIANQARALLDTITSENRSEKEAEFDRMMADSDSYADRAQKMERAEARSREFEGINTKVVGETITARGSSDEGETRANIRAAYLRGEITESELRAQSVGSASGGGYTVPDEAMASLVEVLKSNGPMLNSSIVTIENTKGGNPLPIPTNDDTANAATLTAEGAEITSTDTSFGLKTLGAYKFTTMFKVSSEFLMDSSLNVEEYVNRNIGLRLSRGVNQYLTSGTGSSQPAGIVTGSSLGLTAADDVSITADELLDLKAAVDAIYGGSFMMTRKTANKVRKIKDSTGQYLWQPSLIVGQPDQFDGATVIFNPYMDEVAAAKKVAIFGDFKAFTVRLAGGVQIKRLNERYADSDQVGFLATMRVDSVVTNSTAIKHLITAAS